MTDAEPTCRRISNASLKRILEREGKRWGVSWVEVEHGDGDMHVLAAQDVPFVMPTDEGFSYGEKCRKPIVEIGSEYTFSHLLQGRVRWHQADLSILASVRQAKERKEKRDRLDDALHAFGADLRGVFKQRVHVAMPRSVRRAVAAMKRRRP